MRLLSHLSQHLYQISQQRILGQWFPYAVLHDVLYHHGFSPSTSALAATLSSVAFPPGQGCATRRARQCKRNCVPWNSTTLGTLCLVPLVLFHWVASGCTPLRYGLMGALSATRLVW